MMDNSKHLSSIDIVITILSLFFIAHQGSSFCAFYTPSIIWGLGSMMLFAVLFFYCVKDQKVFSFLLPFVSLALIKTIFSHFSEYGKESLIYELTGFFQTCIYPLLTYYLLRRDNKKQILFILCFFLVIHCTTCVSTLLAYDLGGDNFVRIGVGDMKDSSPAQYEMRMKLNIGDFYTSYGSTAMLPLLIMLLKWRKSFSHTRLVTILSLTSIFLFVSVIYVAQYTISFATALLACLLIFCPPIVSARYVKKSVIIAIPIALLLWAFVPPILQGLAQISNSETMSTRFVDLANFVSTGNDISETGSDFTERQIRYQKAIETIFNYPVIGSWDNNSHSGHSFILDNIAMMGIFGLILIIIYYKIFLAYTTKPYSREGWIGYYYYGILVITIFFIFNPAGLYAYTGFVYPISAYLMNGFVSDHNIMN